MAKWTAEQRTKFAATMAEKRTKFDTLSKRRQHELQEKDSLREHVAYIYGRIEVEIEHYSRSNNVSFTALTEGVASLLQHPKGG